jgi:hypothetical protein
LHTGEICHCVINALQRVSDQSSSDLDGDGLQRRMRYHLRVIDRETRIEIHDPVAPHFTVPCLAHVSREIAMAQRLDPVCPGPNLMSSVQVTRAYPAPGNKAERIFIERPE